MRSCIIAARTSRRGEARNGPHRLTSYLDDLTAKGSAVPASRLLGRGPSKRSQRCGLPSKERYARTDYGRIELLGYFDVGGSLEPTYLAGEYQAAGVVYGTKLDMNRVFAAVVREGWSMAIRA